MAIDTRVDVDVTFEVTAPVGSNVELLGMVLTRNANIPLNADGIGLVSFSDSADIGNFFGTPSPEYDAGRIILQADDGAPSRASRVYYGAYPDAGQTTWVRGRQVTTTIDQFKAISDGAFNITLAGTQLALTMDLGIVTSYSEVADILQTHIRAGVSDPPPAIAAATVIYDPSFRAFIIRAGGAPEDGQTISAISGNIADAMNIASTQNPIISVGVAPRTLAEIMSDMTDILAGISAFTTAWEATITEMVGFSQMLGQETMRTYLPWDADATGALIDPDSTDNNAVTLAALDADVALQYGNMDEAVENGGTYTSGVIYSAMPMGIEGGINPLTGNAIPNFKFRRFSGAPYNVNTTRVARALRAKNVNFYGNYALAQPEFRYFSNGGMFGRWLWLDHDAAAKLLKRQALQVQLDGLNSPRRIPQTPEGEEIIYSVYKAGVVDWGIANGIFQAGVLLDEAQRAKLIRETQDSTSVSFLYARGYYLSVSLAAPVARKARSSTINRLWWCYGGAVNYLTLNVAAFI